MLLVTYGCDMKTHYRAHAVVERPKSILRPLMRLEGKCIHERVFPGLGSGLKKFLWKHHLPLALD